jgi:hypothetical protein
MRSKFNPENGSFTLEECGIHSEEPKAYANKVIKPPSKLWKEVATSVSFEMYDRALTGHVFSKAEGDYQVCLCIHMRHEKQCSDVNLSMYVCLCRCSRVDNMWIVECVVECGRTRRPRPSPSRSQDSIPSCTSKMCRPLSPGYMRDTLSCMPLWHGNSSSIFSEAIVEWEGAYIPSRYEYYDCSCSTLDLDTVILIVVVAAFRMSSSQSVQADVSH